MHHLAFRPLLVRRGVVHVPLSARVLTNHLSNQASKDPWSILGVKRGASMDEVKKAYRKKAMQHHPDRNKNDPNAEVKFKECTAALDYIAKGGNGSFSANDSSGGFSSQHRGFSPGGMGHDEDIERILRETFGNVEGIMRQMHGMRGPGGMGGMGGTEGMGGMGSFSEIRTMVQRPDGRITMRVERRHRDGRVEVSEEDAGLTAQQMREQQEAMAKAMGSAAKTIAGTIAKEAAKAAAAHVANSVKGKVQSVLGGIRDGIMGAFSSDKKTTKK